MSAISGSVREGVAVDGGPQQSLCLTERDLQLNSDFRVNDAAST